MTRTLIIARHAEAADAVAGDDKGRPLTARGRSQSESCGLALRQEGHIPQIIIHSTAKRIIQTRDRHMSKWFEPPYLIEDERLYSPPQGLTPANLLHFFNRIMDQADDDAHTLMVLAHNPEIGQFAEILNRGYPEPLARGYPSGTACVFTSDAERWYDVAPDNARLVLIVLGGEKVIRAKALQANRPAEPRAPEAT